MGMMICLRQIPRCVILCVRQFDLVHKFSWIPYEEAEISTFAHMTSCYCTRVMCHYVLCQPFAGLNFWYLYANRCIFAALGFGIRETIRYSNTIQNSEATVEGFSPFVRRGTRCGRFAMLFPNKVQHFLAT